MTVVDGKVGHDDLCEGAPDIEPREEGDDVRVRVGQVAVERAHQVVGLAANARDGVADEEHARLRQHILHVQLLALALDPVPDRRVAIPIHHVLPLALFEVAHAEQELLRLLRIHDAARLAHGELEAEHHPPRKRPPSDGHTLFVLLRRARLRDDDGRKIENRVAPVAAKGDIILAPKIPCVHRLGDETPDSEGAERPNVRSNASEFGQVGDGHIVELVARHAEAKREEDAEHDERLQ